MKNISLSCLLLLILSCHSPKAPQKSDPKEILTEFQKAITQTELFQYTVDQTIRVDYHSTFREKLLTYNNKQGVVSEDMDGEILRIFIDGKEYRHPDRALAAPLVLSEIKNTVRDALNFPQKYVLASRADTVFITQLGYEQKLLFNSQHLPVYYEIPSSQFVYHIHYENAQPLQQEVDTYLTYIEHKEQQSSYEFGIYLSSTVWAEDIKYAGLAEANNSYTEWTLVNIEKKELIHVTTNNSPSELDEEIETCFPQTIFNESITDDYDFAIGGHIMENEISFPSANEFVLDEEALEQEADEAIQGIYCDRRTYPFSINKEQFLYVDYASCGEGAWSQYEIYKVYKGKYQKILEQIIVCD
ncbi:hypothetical protein [Bacteroides sp. 519]|uniref:hypothetical protein n=1 Tax=Bacteroides sp. 519 TaxID=2302937 RepID=UPI0013D5F855|nr:hypothetical protein [Bacteroides sp. 519]NDV59951.1 hypothetical protein [Bacteroides sp. 519]